MKVILVGYKGSQKIREASMYLAEKYLPDFDIACLEYLGDIEGWSKYIAEYLKILNDKYIIFALDDYLLAEPINMAIFGLLVRGMDNAVLAKLCKCTPQENAEYPVTTQYTLWNREYLISLLEQTTTPWDFEISGSRIFKETGQKALFDSALTYFTNSSLSPRWEGVDLKGLNEEDIKKVQELI